MKEQIFFLFHFYFKEKVIRAIIEEPSMREMIKEEVDYFNKKRNDKNFEESCKKFG